MAVTAVALPAIGLALAIGWLDSASLWLRDAGLTGWALVVLVGGAACGLALLPTHALSLVAGYALGPIGGLSAAMAAIAGGAWIGHRVGGRLVGHEAMAELMRRPVTAALWRNMVGVGGWRALLSVALVRLPPQIPFSLVNVLAAALGVGRSHHVAGTVVGMAPRAAVVVWAGAILEDLRVAEPPAAVTWIAFAGAAAGLGGLAWWSWRVIRRQQKLSASSDSRPSVEPVGAGC